MGILVAKLTSRRLSHHVQRLFNSDAQKRLDEFAVQFETLEKDIRATMEALGKVYQVTPSTDGPEKRDESKALSRFRQSTEDLHAKSGRLADYLDHEVKQGGYFSIAPVDGVRRVVESVSRGLFLLGQLIISLSPEAKTKTLDLENRVRISEAVKNNYKICDIIDKSATDINVKLYSDQVRHTCASVLDAYFGMPRQTPPPVQPDQTIEGINEPQG